MRIKIAKKVWDKLGKTAATKSKSKIVGEAVIMTLSDLYKKGILSQEEVVSLIMPIDQIIEQRIKDQ